MYYAFGDFSNTGYNEKEMKIRFSPYLFFVLIVAIGGSLWALFRFAPQGATYTNILPELVFGGFFVVALLVHFYLVRMSAVLNNIQSFDDELQVKNERFRIIAEGLNDGVWDWNIKTNEVYFSKDWERMLHFSPVSGSTGGGEISDEKRIQYNSDWWAGRIHPEDINAVNALMEGHFSGTASYYKAEYRIKNGHGNYRWILDRGRVVKNESGEIARMVGITQDIQNLKNGELVLKKRTRELEEAKDHIEQAKVHSDAVLESIGEGVIAVNPGGIISVANASSASMLGMHRDKMLGMAFPDAIPEEEDRHERALSKEDRLVYKTLASGERYTGLFHYCRQNGVKFPVAVTSAPIRLDEELLGAIVVFRDMTREMEIDKQKTEFVSLASHQLRTPLSAIRWYSESVLNEKFGELNEKQKKYLQEIYDSNLRMIELVSALLNVSRIEMGVFAVEPEEVDLWKMFEGVVNELIPAMEEKGIRFTKDYESVPRSFYADKNLMRIVFQNLLSNAVKYTPISGRVSVSVRQIGESLRIEVSDNGYGIPEKEQPKMFSKLFRADNVKTKNVKGTGLGLYIIKSVVEKSGGKIWFESTENEGSTFYVELPMSGMRMVEGTKGLEG